MFVPSITRSVAFAAAIVLTAGGSAWAQPAKPGAPAQPTASESTAQPSAPAPSNAPAKPGAPEKAAVFNFQLANLGILPPTAEDKARLPHLSQMLRDLLAKSGRYQIVSTDPVKAQAQSNDLRSCGGCANDFAKKLGAQLAITGEIQKVSVLILNINVYIKDVDSSKPEQAYSVDIRGDNDLSFDHGIKYLVKHNILGE